MVSPSLLEKNKANPSSLYRNPVCPRKRITQQQLWYSSLIQSRAVNTITGIGTMILPGLNAILTVVLISYIPPVVGDNGDDFTNNLFSDLAPLLALFGERVAQQFMSQSMGWADITIFAMAPLGIITAIVGAIRVAGPGWLKSVVGRAREAYAVPELELLSSTSSDICELWNGVTLVKVLGSPTVVELLYFSTHDGTNNCPVHAGSDSDVMAHSGIDVSKACTPTEITCRRTNILRLIRWCIPRTPFPRAFRNRSKSGRRQSDIEAHQPVTRKNSYYDDKPLIKPSAPNISLNITEPVSQKTLWGVASIGIILQFGVLLFDGFTTYHPSLRNNFQKNGRPITVYAFPVTAIGTLLVVAGMMICAYLVESATEEIELQYMRGEKVCNCMRLLWLQKHGKVGDQLFESYAVFAHGSRASIRTSRRREPQMDKEPNRGVSQSVLAPSNYLKKYSRTGAEGLCTVGTMTSVIGFVAQFMGLRAMPWTATIAQLIATGTMTGLRASVRTAGLTQEPDTYKLPLGYELDWLATRLGNLQQAPLSTMLSEHSMGEGFWTQVSWKWSVVTGQCAHRFQIYDNETGEHHGRETRSWSTLRKLRVSGRANEVVAARIRLQSLTKWTREGSMASCVIKAIEEVMNLIFDSDDVKIRKKHAGRLDFEWPIFIRFEGREEPYFFQISRRTPTASWKMKDRSRVEAILSLWRFTLRQERQALVQAVKELRESKSEFGSIASSETQPEHNSESEWSDETERKFEVLRFLGPSNAVSRRDYKVWVEQGTPFITFVCGMPNSGYPAIGFPASPLQLRDDDDDDDDDNEDNDDMDPDPNETDDEDSPTDSSSTDGETHSEDETYDGLTDLDIDDEENEQDTDSEEMNARSDDTPVANSFTELEQDSHPTLCVVTTSSFERICAQELFSTFMWHVVENIKTVVTKTVLTTHPNPSTTEGWEPVSFRNAFLDTIVRAVESTELGVGEDIYMSIIPQLRSSGLFAGMDLEPAILVRHVKIMVAVFESRQDWEESRKACVWLHKKCFEYMEESPKPFFEAALLLADFSASAGEAAVMCSGNELKDLKETLLGMSISSLEEVSNTKHGNMIIKILGKAYQTWAGGIKRLARLSGNRGILDYTTASVITELLRTWYPKSDDDRHILGWTKLHHATVTMSAQSSGSPLRKPDDLVIDAKDRDGMTPLHWAVLNNKTDWVEALLKSRSDSNSKDNFGRTPLYLSLTRGHKEITNILQEGGGILDGWSRYISETSDDGEVERLLDSEGIYLNIQDSDGRTPLRLAIGADRKVLAKMLLERGADPNAVLKSSGESALYPSSAAGDLETVELLLKYKANPSHPTIYGWTPLHWAVGNGHDAVAKALLDAGADPTAVSDTGKTPLDMTSRSEMRAVIQKYLSKSPVQE